MWPSALQQGIRPVWALILTLTNELLAGATARLFFVLRFRLQVAGPPRQAVVHFQHEEDPLRPQHLPAPVSTEFHFVKKKAFQNSFPRTELKMSGCQAACERQATSNPASKQGCKAVHFCAGCARGNCRLLSDTANGPSGVELTDKFPRPTFGVDYAQIESC